MYSKACNKRVEKERKSMRETRRARVVEDGRAWRKEKGRREWGERVPKYRDRGARKRNPGSVRIESQKHEGNSRGDRKGRMRRPWLPPRRSLYIPSRSMGTQGKTLYGWASKERRIGSGERSAWLVRRERTVFRLGQWEPERERILDSEQVWRQEVRIQVRGDGLRKGERHSRERERERGKVSIPGTGLGVVGKKRGRFSARSRGPVSVTALRHWGKESTAWGRSEWRVRRSGSEEVRRKSLERGSKGKGQIWSGRGRRERRTGGGMVERQDLGHQQGRKDLLVPREVRGLYSNLRVQRGREVYESKQVEWGKQASSTKFALEGGVVEGVRQGYTSMHTKRVTKELQTWREEEGEDGRVRKFSSENMGRRACRGKLQRGQVQWGRSTSVRDKLVFSSGLRPKKGGNATGT